MAKILITGNPNKDLCAALVPLLEADGHTCTCVSRSTGHDFEKDGTVSAVVRLAADHDVFINLYANYFFKAVILAQRVFESWNARGFSSRRLINVGSTTDRVRKGKSKLYHYEKLALRELSNGLSLIGVWDRGPKVTHVSFGTLSNRSEDHDGRACLEMVTAAEYIRWILRQPPGVNINEISIDPVQGEQV